MHFILTVTGSDGVPVSMEVDSLNISVQVDASRPSQLPGMRSAFSFSYFEEYARTVVLDFSLDTVGYSGELSFPISGDIEGIDWVSASKDNGSVDFQKAETLLDVSAVIKGW